MKPALRLFIFLLCSFFHGTGNAYTITSSSKAQISTNAQFVKQSHFFTSDAPVLAVNTDADDQDDLNDSEEDDQDDVTRHDSFPRSLISFYYTLSLRDKFYSETNHRFLYKHTCQLTSCIYLVQRSLRI